MTRASWVSLLLLIACAPAHAAYSGLTLIPTADLLGPAGVCLDYQVLGPLPVGSGVDAAFVNTQFAVGNRAELGIDFDLTAEAPTGALFNAKLLLRPVEAGLGLALGVYNVGERVSPTTYLAATRGGGPVRLHLGAQLTPEDETQGFGGLDYSLTDRIQLYLDYVAGDENASALGISYQFTERWGVLFAWQRPNDRELEDGFVLDLGCVWPVD